MIGMMEYSKVPKILVISVNEERLYEMGTMETLLGTSKL